MVLHDLRFATLWRSVANRSTARHALNELTGLRHRVSAVDHSARTSRQTLAIRRHTRGPQNALDVEPLDRLVVIDALELARQHRIVEAEAWTERPQRRRRPRRSARATRSPTATGTTPATPPDSGRPNRDGRWSNPPQRRPPRCRKAGTTAASPHRARSRVAALSRVHPVPASAATGAPTAPVRLRTGQQGNQFGDGSRRPPSQFRGLDGATLVEQFLDALVPRGVNGVEDALASGVAQRLDPAFHFLILARCITQQRSDVLQLEAIGFASQSQIDTHLRPVAAMEGPAPLLPHFQQTIRFRHSPARTTTRPAGYACIE